MADEIEVHIDYEGETKFVGICRYFVKRGNRSSLFEYANSWLKHPNAFAIDPDNLPLQAGPFYRTSPKSGLPGALRDTAPDRWGQQLIKRAYRKARIERPLSEIDFLLAINDATRIGALRYKRTDESTFDHDIDRYRVPPLIKLPALLNAAEAVHTNSETAEDLKLLLNEGSPLGGARPKSVVQDSDGTLAIAKFPKNDDDWSVPHGEILLMSLARKAGINVADARLLDVTGRSVAVITRFDRDGNRRIPFLSAMTLCGKDDGEEAAYTDIAEVIRQYSGAPTEDLHELWRRVVFNVLAANLDDHLRNHGFLFNRKRGWRLSPAYDLNPVPAAEKVRELTTWISEEGPEASLELALSAAKYFKLKNDEAILIIDEVSTAFTRWKDSARQLGISDYDIEVFATALPPVQ